MKLQRMSQKVQERVPRKQGLKPEDAYGFVYMSSCSRASSTKTRIETTWSHTLREFCRRQSSRASSTKTRIETTGFDADLLDGNHVQERVPRKQGLKRSSIPMAESPHAVQERVPRKQGLKHFTSNMHLICIHSSRASSTKTRIETD